MVSYEKEVLDSINKWISDRIQSSRFSGPFCRDFAVEIRSVPRSDTVDDLLARLVHLREWIDAYPKKKPYQGPKFTNRIVCMISACKSVISRRDFSVTVPIRNT